MLKINVVGNIASHFEMRTRGEQKCAIIRIASDRRYTDKNGDALVDYVSVKVRGPLAESCVKNTTNAQWQTALNEKLMHCFYTLMVKIIVLLLQRRVFSDKMMYKEQYG